MQGVGGRLNGVEMRDGNIRIRIESSDHNVVEVDMRGWLLTRDESKDEKSIESKAERRARVNEARKKEVVVIKGSTYHQGMCLMQVFEII